MSKIVKPYVADVDTTLGRARDLEVVELNKKTVLVRLPNGDVIKRHMEKHRVKLKFVGI